MLDKNVPRYVFFTKGVGYHRDPLFSFELALRDAGIEKFNLVPVSSILPPGVKVISKAEGLAMLKPGQIVFCVLSKYTSNDLGKEIFASIGYAFPEGETKVGYISEYYGIWDEKYVDYAGKIAKEMVESNFKIKVKNYGTIISKAKVKDYTTVVAAAVFVL